MKKFIFAISVLCSINFFNQFFVARSVFIFDAIFRNKSLIYYLFHRSIKCSFLIVLVMTVFSQSRALTLTCSFRTFVSSFAGDLYGCEGELIRTDVNDVDVVEVTGVHQHGKNNDDVGFLIVKTQNMPRMPKQIEKFFQNVIILQMVNNGLSSISKEDFKPFPNFLSFFYIQIL